MPRNRTRSNPSNTERGERSTKIITRRRYTASHPDSGDETEDVVTGELQIFATEPAFVRVQHGMTISLGNYEFVRVDVALTVPCYTEDIDVTVHRVGEDVSAYLEDEVASYDEREGS